MGETNKSLYYQNAVACITNEGKQCLIKQDSGIKFSVIGAVLFQDNKNYVGIHWKNNTMQYLNLNQLKKYTNIVVKDIEYTYKGQTFIPNSERKYNNVLSYLELHCLPITYTYGKQIEEGIEANYLSYNFSIGVDDVIIKNPNNVNMYFDGVAFLGIPYRLKEEDADASMNYNVVNLQKPVLFAIEYFPISNNSNDDGMIIEKIPLFYKQNKLLTFNTELHFTLEKDVVIDEVDVMYEINNIQYNLKDEQDKPFSIYKGFGFHIVNNGYSDVRI